MLRPRPRNRRRRKRLLHEPKHLLAAALRDGLQAAELESRELDTARRADGDEAEVGQKVAWEHGAVHAEAIRRRRALAVAVGERLERPRSAVSRLPDRRPEQGLQH